MKKQAIILAAGEGTRMKSALPKVLHQAVGKPLVLHVLEGAQQSGADHLIVVVGHGADEVKAVLPPGTASVLQEQQLGTGHAVQMAAHLIQPDALVLVLCGDAPLLRPETLEALAREHQQRQNAATVLSARLSQPFGYGRILRNDRQELLGIVEEKDACHEEKQIDEINSGTYCFSGKALLQVLPQLSNANRQQEYYLTDTLALLRESGQRVGVHFLTDPEEIMAVNSRTQLAQVEGIFRRRINEAHMAAGVTLIHPENTYIGPEVTIGRDTLIEPGVMLEGNTTIGETCIIGQNSRLTDATLGNRVQITHSTLCQAFVDDDTTVGPYAYLRPETHVGKRVRIGDFVEVKKSVIGDDSRAAHLAYIGDADVGRNVNIGCGVVFVNYDGRKKSRTIVEDDAFIGSNSNLVAPVVVEKGGYVAAGSTINQNVPADALAIARQRQRNIQGWNKRS
ncbi:bifunctional UDP-N-acetylglucosamine diphosphorylase/glucosamine-1-phosphate N-acetyltransferase GlmU [Anoxynatronum sibiricum]|uniref:Bifunctional protein GlmU n=1 Tax=Anoxynatronum sibiricum TaxID=210623 RepID=A0ABU9VWD7_9CLOT